MSNPEAAIAALYDHEQEDPREREFDAPDWGGDELFSSTPRRRRFQGDRARLRDTGEHPLPKLRPAGADHTERVHHRPSVTVPSESERAEKLERLESLERAEIAPRYEISPSGRKIVTVTGHPEGRPFTTRRRPSPSVDQRLSHRPDRIAAWAFGLGPLLIIIAALTAH